MDVDGADLAVRVAFEDGCQGAGGLGLHDRVATDRRVRAADGLERQSEVDDRVAGPPAQAVG
jgi:hypothetical protein